MKHIIGIKYGRGATANITETGPALAPDVIQAIFPEQNWHMVLPDEYRYTDIISDRFGENAKIQQKIYAATPHAPHILIGGDHSVNFGHFCAIADHLDTDDLCLVYIDAHLDIHTPQSSQIQASGAPHGTNVRALLGDGDERWLSIPRRRPALRTKNIFYIASRSFEPAESEFVLANNINISYAKDIHNISDIQEIISNIRQQIGNRPYVVSFDFDAIDPQYFSDVLVPAAGGINPDMAKILVSSFQDAYSFEFVEYAPSGDKKSLDIINELLQILIK